MNDFNKTPELFYRFRPPIVCHKTDKFPEKTVFDELKNQEIYFASLEQLNDPMDGWLNVYLEGDKVLWENFINHYFLCLYCNISYIEIMGDTLINFPKEIIVNRLNIPLTTKFQKAYKDLKSKIYQNEVVNSLLSILIEKKKVYPNELFLLLYLFHREFIFIASEIAEKAQPNSPLVKNYKFILKEIDSVNIKIIKESVTFLKQNQLRAFSEIVNGISEKMYLISRYNYSKKAMGFNNYKDNVHTFFARYPKIFLNKFANFALPEHYVASFSSKKDDSSMWGHYAHGHKGLCLIFKPEALEINMTNKQKCKLLPVDYDPVSPELNLFTNLGTLTFNDINDHWLTHSGELSIYAKDYFNDFHNKYWENLTRKICHKFHDWAYEKEYRLVADDLLWGKDTKRIYQYDFNMLEGIIFGINTTDDLKMKVLEIIDEKCHTHKRNSFKFYQAEYLPHQDKIHNREMVLNLK